MPATHKFKLTRIAPTPSGFLHLGNALSLIVTAEAASRTGADVLLRIDDLDRPRVREEYIRDIFQTLNYLDVKWQLGPSDADAFAKQYSQMHRLSLYRSALEKLARGNRVFACCCPRSALDGKPYPGTCLHAGHPLETPGAAWRFNTSGAGRLVFTDYSGKTITGKLPPSMQHFVVRKKDGMPAYQLSSLIDDIHFGVDLIVRGEDLFDSTLAQLLLAEALHETSFLRTTFIHHRLLTDERGAKLSKSAGDASVMHYRKSGTPLLRLIEMIGLHLGVSGLATPAVLFDHAVAK
jgi:glutamyl/glutaminyl-tRNA synthetase